MSLLTIIQNVADAIAIPRPTAVISSTSQQVRQLLSLANREGIALAKRHDWQNLQKETSFTATATTTQSGAIPSDFDRFINETMYNRTMQREVRGPISPQQWQLEVSTVASTIIEAFRRRGNDLLITPTPTAGDSYYYEYVSKNWCTDSSETTDAAAWAVDTDIGLLDEEAMTLGIIVRFKKMKGFDYAEEYRDYELMVANLITRDGGKPRLDAGGNAMAGPYRPYIQDGNYTL